MVANESTALPDLDPQHLAGQRASGLSDETIAASGIHTERSYGKLAAIIGWKKWPPKMGPAMVIPFRHADGEMNGYRRLTPSNPKKDRNGKPRKYESPKGQPNRPYFPPGTTDKLKDGGCPLLIVEGEKKVRRVSVSAGLQNVEMPV